jgi:excisionase family DNA binding protein
MAHGTPTAKESNGTTQSAGIGTRKRGRKKRKTTNEITPDILQKRVTVRPREYAALTGTPLPTVYKYIASGFLSASRMGNTIRIPVSEVR